MLLCNHQYEWFENFSQMFRGFSRDVKLMLHIDTYNKTNMMIYIYIQSRLVYSEGEVTTLRCAAEGVPNPVISWFRDKSNIPIGKYQV